MIINHNMASLNTYRQLSTNNSNSARSLEKLSSGLRINKAGDDAAGLALSEKMRGQIRGLDQAARNSQDGISMIQTAEGSLSETHSILQRMRELAVQGSNDTLTDDDRAEIQKEASQLVEEIDKIGNTTEFNTKKLLNGSVGQSLASNNTYDLANGDYNAVKAVSATTDTETGAYNAAFTTVATKGTQASTGAFASGSLAAGQWMKINDVQIDLSAADTKSTIIGKINALSDQTGVTASVGANGGVSFTNTDYGNTTMKLQGSAAAVATALGNSQVSAAGTTTAVGVDAVATIQGAAATTLSGNRVTLNANGVEANGLTVELQGYDTAAKMTATALNSEAAVVTLLTGANETLTINGTLIFDQAGGSAIASTRAALINAVNSQSGNTGVTAALDTNGAIEFSSVAKGDAAAMTITMTNTLDNQFKTGTTTVALAAGVANLGSDGLANNDSATITVNSNNTLSLHVGANADQTMAVDISDMRASAIGTSVANESSLDSISDLKSKSALTSKQGSEDAIKILDEAIKNVSAERSKLGAFTNRLEHTITNLGTSSENLTAAESRVRDVDMAKEMMQFQKNNILSQAAQAMLAQANQAPQGVLQLLR